MSEDDLLEMLEEAGGAEDPAAAVRQQCDEWVQAAHLHRYVTAVPGADSAPVRVRDALVEVRAHLDQLEVILSNMAALRTGTAVSARQLENRADDAWDDQAQRERSRQHREYEGAQERYAYWNLATRVQRHAARDARDLADYVKVTYERVRLAYDGLNETRRDLAARLTHLRWETTLEQ